MIQYGNYEILRAISRKRWGENSDYSWLNSSAKYLNKYLNAYNGTGDRLIVLYGDKDVKKMDTKSYIILPGTPLQVRKPAHRFLCLSLLPSISALYLSWVKICYVIKSVYRVIESG